LGTQDFGMYGRTDEQKDVRMEKCKS